MPMFPASLRVATTRAAQRLLLLQRRCLQDTGPLPPELSTAALLSPNAALASSSSSPSHRYAELVHSGNVRHDSHQHAVVEQFDRLWSELPQYQEAMVQHSLNVQQWLSDWDHARDTLVAAKVRSAARRKTSLLQRYLVVPVANAVEGAALSIDRLPQIAFLTSTLSVPKLVQWAKERTQEADNQVLIVYEGDIDTKVGRPCPEPPARPQGMYLHGSVGTGKSLCMDLFFASTEGRATQRRRVHFNAFMVEVQARMHAYNQSDDGKQRVSRAHLAMRAGRGPRAGVATAMRKEREALEAAARATKAAAAAAASVSTRAPLRVGGGVTIVGRSGDARPLPMVQGRDVHDPFSAIARELLGPAADHGGLLCFDELQVNDPFNAVAVREIFLRLLELGVVIVTTSNRELRSLNRWKSTTGDPTFTPLVTAMSTACVQVSLDAGVDYRRAEQHRPEAASDGYLLGGSTQDLDRLFATLRDQIAADCTIISHGPGAGGVGDGGSSSSSSSSKRKGTHVDAAASATSTTTTAAATAAAATTTTPTAASAAACAASVEEHFTNAEIAVLFGRTLVVPEGTWRGPGGSRRGVARFTFQQLCGANLGSSDYASLAAHFSVVMVDNIPVMDFETRAYARRFITLVDELYNRRVRLVCTAAAEIDHLFDDVSGSNANYDAAYHMEQMAFETEAVDNKSRFDVTKSASVAASSGVVGGGSGRAPVDAGGGDSGGGGGGYTATRSLDNYSGEDEEFAFSRAASRLHEMQTAHYYTHAELLTDEGASFDVDAADPKLTL